MELHAKSEGRSRLSLRRPVRTIRREDIWHRAYDQCRSTRGKVWTDRDFGTSTRTGAAGGFANWRLRSGRRLPTGPIRRGSYRRPMANSAAGTRPGVNRVCMDSAMMCGTDLLKPPFHQTQCAYRPGRNAQRRW